MQSGGWQPKNQPLDAASIAREVWSSCTDQAERKEITFRIQGDHTVVADPDALRQVLSNLFDNAIRYAPAGGRIDVVMRRVFPPGKPGRFVDIEVRDNGVGVPPDVQAKMFTPFFSTKPTGEGTGLGLSISYEIIVQQHGGTITVDSRLDEFTEFVIRLPRMSAPAEETRMTTGVTA